MDVILGAKGNCWFRVMSTRDLPRNDRLPNYLIADRTELSGHHHPNRQYPERWTHQKEAVCVDMSPTIAFMQVGEHQRPVQSMNGTAGRTNGDPCLPTEVVHRLDVVWVVPIISIQKGKGVVALIHCRHRTDPAQYCHGRGAASAG